MAHARDSRKFAPLHTRHEGVPVVVRAVAAWIQFDAPAGAGVIRAIKEDQLHA